MREGLDRFALEPRARERQNFLGRAFDRHEPLRRALLVNGRHPVLAVTTRSQLVQRILPAEPPTIDAEVERRGEERGLRGAAPDVLRVLGDLGLVAEDTDGERARQKLIGLVVAPRALRRGQVLAATEMPRGGGHTVFGERARLVETDHGRRAEASTAARRRTSIRRCIMRCIPSARVVVATAGRPSGTAATASDSAARTISIAGTPRKSPRPSARAQKPSEAATSWPPM